MDDRDTADGPGAGIPADVLATIHQRYLDMVDRALVQNHALFLRIVGEGGISSGTDSRPAPMPTRQDTPLPGDLVPALLALVAETTGYPLDTLAPDMDMEADLAIDSIKRFEILIALRERFPHLPELDTDTVARLSTLGDVFTALGAPADPSPDVFGTVAQLTSYPAAMLDPGMVLGADLGLDDDAVADLLVRLRAPHGGTAEGPDATWTLAGLAAFVEGKATG